MESMAEEVVRCIGKGIYNKEPIECFRGIGGNDKFVFNDEDALKSFSLLPDAKKSKDSTAYEPVSNEILTYLDVWLVKKDFKGSYAEEYLTLTSEAYISKYNTSIFRSDNCWRGNALEKFDRQPLPDYKHWQTSGELHYMPYEVRHDFPKGPWDDCPGIFLPDKILQTCFRALPNPSTENIKSVALLPWVSKEQAEEYFTNARQQLIELKDEDVKRETWKRHPLYKDDKVKLRNMCIDAGLPATGKKYELVQGIAEKGL